MNIGYQYILLIIAGVAGMAWGLPAAHRLRRPFDAVVGAGRGDRTVLSEE